MGRPPPRSKPKGLARRAGGLSMEGAAPAPDPLVVRLGHALFSVVEPAPGHARAFHRWYEREHFHAGCMVGPGFFAGRRWVATGALERHVAGSGAGRSGCYAVTYWLGDNDYDATEAWAVERVLALHAAGRMFAESRQIHTAFYDYRWQLTRDPDPVPAELALDHPFAGLVALVVSRTPGTSQTELDDWHRGAGLGTALPGSSAALCLGLSQRDLPAAAPANTPRDPDFARKSVVLCFLDDEPTRGWSGELRKHGSRLAASGLGTLVHEFAFVPTVPGSDRYTDELE